ncbi:MAG: lactate utilization protein [Gammaproteobacteria bacterium]|nr:lactate utilization protein [Gammaproteobacteria bacterium]
MNELNQKTARDNILARLRNNRMTQSASPAPYLPSYGWSQAEKIQRLSERMQAVRGEVHRMPRTDWVGWLNQELPKRKLHNILLGETANAELFRAQADAALTLHRYDRVIEDWKQDLFKQVDVGITDTLGGIAESGSLILWPTPQEPRLLSLVPPVHIALLEADKIVDNFAQAMHQQHWSEHMPTNALLISGPSKTADIEQTLAYGIHGPKQLIVLILE